MTNQKDQYIKNLEEAVNVFMQPLRNIRFSVAIKAMSGCSVLSFKNKSINHRKLLVLMIKAMRLAGTKASEAGIFTARPNEAGNKIEPFVKKALRDVGLQAETPVAASGKRKATGYPDIEISDKQGRVTYLECKTYNIKNINTTQRAFYFSPSKDFKITKNALHLMVSFQIEKEKRKSKLAYVPKHWKLYTLENLLIDVKHEFNQSNQKLYGSKSDPSSLLAEEKI